MATSIESSDPLTYAIIGAAMEVHRNLGCGFLEAVYQECLAIELACRQVPFVREVQLPIFYKSYQLATHYRADFICFDTVVVEIKALSRYSGTEVSQMINYLKAAGKHTGLLINFGARSLQWQRLVN